MARLRYVKTLEQVKRDAERNPEFLSSVVRSLRVVYETDPALAAALVPRPLVPAPRPEIQVTFSHVAMQLPGLTIEIGSTIFGARASYDGEEGTWLVTMPMTTRAGGARRPRHLRRAEEDRADRASSGRATPSRRR